MAKEGIHPTFYPDATITCSCGHVHQAGATVQAIRTDICSNCHPFYTGEQRIIDTAGQVERFMRRLQTGTTKRDTPPAERRTRKPVIETVSDED